MTPLVLAGLAAWALLLWPRRPVSARLGADVEHERGRPPPAVAMAAADGGPTGRAAASYLDVADAVSLLVLALRGGVGVTEAIESVGRRVAGIVGGHLLTVAAAQRWGAEESATWSSVPAAWQPVARAIRMANAAGVPPADLLLAAAHDMRRREAARLEIATATLGVRIVLPLGLVFLPAFVLTTVLPVVLALAADVLSGP